MKLWDKLLWAIEFKSDYDRTGETHIISTLWNGGFATGYLNEPARALVFQTRKDAREWVENRQDISDTWHFKVVRVRETVRAV